MKYEYEINMEKFRPVKDLILAHVDEFKLVIKPDMWFIKCVDPEHVAMFEIEIHSKEFERFDDVEENHEFGMDIIAIKDMYAGTNKSYRNKTDIGFVFNLETNSCTMNNGRIERSFQFIDPSGISDPKVPTLNLPVEIEVPAKDTYEIINDIKRLGPEFMVMRTEPNTGNFQVYGYLDLDVVKRDFPVHMSDMIISGFSTKYLHGLLKPLVQHTQLKIHLGTDYPIKMINAYEGIRITLLLAPRIDANDVGFETPESIERRKAKLAEENKEEPEEIEPETEDHEEIKETEPVKAIEPEPKTEPEPITEPEPDWQPAEPETTEPVKIQNTETGEIGILLGRTETPGYTVDINGFITWWKESECIEA